MEQWVTSSNDALRITLLDAPHIKSATFHPTFTYPIFGEQETIYGYLDLHLELHLRSDTLEGSLEDIYKSKLEKKAAKIDDPRSTLMKFLPAGDIYASPAELSRKSSKSSFKPFGKKIHTYARAKEGKGKGKGKAGASTVSVDIDDPDARVFEIYHCTWDTPGFREYHRRMQIFTLLFIEGASYIEEDETNWEFMVVYEVSKKPQENGSATNGHSTSERYHFIGYTSLYNFWFYPDQTRLRLSQFVILPPYQSQGHGAELYNQVVKLASQRDNVYELTIEDPSEAFDKLRDVNDFKRLMSAEDGFLQRAGEYVKGGALKPPIDRIWSEKERVKHKIAKRQWNRLMEMLQLVMLDEKDDDQIKKYRLQVRHDFEARCYRANADHPLSSCYCRSKLACFASIEKFLKSYLDMKRWANCKRLSKAYWTSTAH